MPFATQIQELVLTEDLTQTEDPLNLILWNDEVNTFDWVIQSLVEICEHSPSQAEQCAWIIHSKGKYAVKKGPEPKLLLMREAFVDRGIGATVE